jgi:hypothetical protein
MPQRRSYRDDRAVTETTADAEKNHIARLRRCDDMSMRKELIEIFLVGAMQVPVRGIGPGIEGRDQAEVAEHAHQQHRAIAADLLQVGADMIRRPDPRARLSDNLRASASRRVDTSGGQDHCVIPQ